MYKQKLGFTLVTAVIIFSAIMYRYLPSISKPTQNNTKLGGKKAAKAYEPSYLSSEYQAIQLAFINKLKNSSPSYPAPRRYKIKFDMGYLRVQGDWAFAHAHLLYNKEERKTSYVYPAALLNRSNKKDWQVVALTDTNFNWDTKDGRSQSDVGSRPSIGEETWIKEMEVITQKWRTQFPSAPQNIFLNPDDMHYQDLGTSQWF